MPTTLRVIVDQVVAPVPGPLGRYTEALTEALIATAPSGCAVEGIVSSSPPDRLRRAAQPVPRALGAVQDQRSHAANSLRRGSSASPPRRAAA